MRTSRKLTSAAIAATAILGGGIALAAWTATGSGSGYAQAKSAQALTTVSATSDTVAQLYPTGSGDLKVRIANANDYNVTITDIAQTALSSITSGDSVCDASNGVTFDGASGLSAVVPARSTGTLVTLPGTVHMSNSSVDACQGETFTIPVTVTGASSAAS